MSATFPTTYHLFTSLPRSSFVLPRGTSYQVHTTYIPRGDHVSCTLGYFIRFYRSFVWFITIYDLRIPGKNKGQIPCSRSKKMANPGIPETYISPLSFWLWVDFPMVCRKCRVTRYDRGMLPLWLYPHFASFWPIGWRYGLISCNSFIKFHVFRPPLWKLFPI